MCLFVLWLILYFFVPIQAKCQERWSLDIPFLVAYELIYSLTFTPHSSQSLISKSKKLSMRKDINFRRPRVIISFNNVLVRGSLERNSPSILSKYNQRSYTICFLNKVGVGFKHDQSPNLLRIYHYSIVDN